MAGIDSNTLNRFKQILSGIPEDRRAVLYNRIKAMSEAERNALIVEFVRRYDNSVGMKAPAEPSGVQASADRRTGPVREQVRQQINAANNPGREWENAEVSGSRAEPPTRPDPRNMPKKKLKKSVRMTIGLAIIGMVLIGSLTVLALTSGIFSSGQGDGEADIDAADQMQASEETMIPTDTPIPTATLTPTPTPTPTPSPVPIRADAPDLTGLTIVLDPGHQQFDNLELETCAPWLGNEKAKCTSGGVGVVTGVGEYALTLEYANIVREYLEQCGATVILTRETNEADISNQQRAAVAVDNDADLFIRIHADSANDSATSGVRVYVPSSGNLVSQNTSNANILGALVAGAEGFEFTAECVRATNQYTGLNYADSLPAFQISLGFLTNSDDEAILMNEENMVEVAAAIAEFANNYVSY